MGIKPKFIVVLVLFAIIIIAGVVVLSFYNKILKVNVDTGGQEAVDFFIPTGSAYKDVVHLLNEQSIIMDTSSFNWVAQKKNYPNHVYPGRYHISRKMNNNELVNLLRSGSQEPVSLTFNNIRTLEKLASVVAGQIEADSMQLIKYLTDPEYLKEKGFSVESIRGIFIPNTYEMYWNTNPDQFIDRMIQEYDRFWNENRKKMAAASGLDQMEIITLASIVDEEALMPDEERRIAGVYINRLNRGMRLQADPTVKFAAGDMTMTRVLNIHLEIDSPYNTYKFAGLPPGPITIPSISAIDAVLDYEHHDYIYFCAKDDFSGYHNFAKTLVQHNKNARSYQNALNRRKILN